MLACALLRPPQCGPMRYPSGSINFVLVGSFFGFSGRQLILILHTHSFLPRSLLPHLFHIFPSSPYSASFSPTHVFPFHSSSPYFPLFFPGLPAVFSAWPDLRGRQALVAVVAAVVDVVAAARLRRLLTVQALVTPLLAVAVGVVVDVAFFHPLEVVAGILLVRLRLNRALPRLG